MLMELTEAQRIRREYLREKRESGEYPIAGLQIFDSIQNLKFSDYVLDYERDVISIYSSYLDDLSSLKLDDTVAFLEFIKNQEILDNQSLEKENGFLISLYFQTVAKEKDNAIDFLLSHMDSGFSREDFIAAHKLLLKGTKNEFFSGFDYRQYDESCVGYKDSATGEEVILYFNLPVSDIEEAIQRTLTFYNSDQYDEHTFLKGQIAHGIVGSLQMFNDGNTRYARILQHIKTSELTAKNLGVDFGLPTMYGTRAYFPQRARYRQLMQELVMNPSDETWDKWFKFNLNASEFALTFLDTHLQPYKTMVRNRKS